MALGKRRNAADTGKAESPGGAFRPMLLAGGLGLLWFVLSPSTGFDDEASAAMAAALTGARLLVDFVGGWIVVSLLRLAIAGGRYALTWTRTGTEGEAP